MIACQDLGAEGRKRLEYALLLIARKHGGDQRTQRAADATLAQWRAQDPANEQAARLAQSAWAATDARGLQGEVPLPDTQRSRDAKTRRRVLSALGMLGVFGVAGALGRWTWLQPVEQLALDTGHGQMLTHTLQDGTRIDLAPATHVRVALYRHRRDIRLTQGEIRLDVTPDAKRPLEVLTPIGRVRVLGTQFTVAVRDAHMTVSVAHGRVAVWRGQEGDFHAEPDALLTAGEGVQWSADGPVATHTVRAEDVGAWREGWLVFDQTPLPEVLARWNDYLSRPLTLEADPALQRMRLTGSFKLREPAVFLSSLPGALPVRVDRDPSGGVTVRRR